MNKKIFSLLLSGVMILALLAGCGAQESTDGAGEAGGEAEVSAEVTSDDVRAALKDGSAIVVDTRENAAYAGWGVGENKLGGHIEGATDFSANWITCEYDDENNIDAMSREEHLEKYMADKKISADTAVILYDENSKDAKVVADYFAGKGLTDIRTFDLNKWDGELVSYENYQLYVPPVVVKKLLDGETVEEIGEVKNLVVLEVSWGTVEESGYLNGHVPTAIHVNSDDFDDEDQQYILDEDSVLFELAKKQGITADTTVVLTGDTIFTCRYASILKYLGVNNLYVMTGGVAGWTNAGYELETTVNEGTPAESYIADVPQNPDVIDTIAETEEMLKSDNFVLVDIRREEEHLGETSGYGYTEEAGRIEGSVYGYAGVDNSSSMLYYDNLDYTMRNGYEILDMWEGAGIDASKHLSFMCGGGYRAAEVLWDAYVMGLTDVSVYADGWCGWTIAGKPFVTGK